MLELADAPTVPEGRLLGGAVRADELLSPAPRDAHTVGPRGGVSGGVRDAAEARDSRGVAQQVEALEFGEP